MTAVHNAAEGPIVAADEFEQIVTDMNSFTFGFGMDPASALLTFLDKRKGAYGQTLETMFGAIGNGVRHAKTLWPGGPAFERPSD